MRKQARPARSRWPSADSICLHVIKRTECTARGTVPPLPRGREAWQPSTGSPDPLRPTTQVRPPARSTLAHPATLLKARSRTSSTASIARRTAHSAGSAALASDAQRQSGQLGRRPDGPAAPPPRPPWSRAGGSGAPGRGKACPGRPDARCPVVPGGGAGALLPVCVFGWTGRGRCGGGAGGPGELLVAVASRIETGLAGLDCTLSPSLFSRCFSSARLAGTDVIYSTLHLEIASFGTCQGMSWQHLDQPCGWICVILLSRCQ